MACIALSRAQAAVGTDPIAIELRQFLVERTDDGKEALKPAAHVKPGDLIEYRAEYRNRSDRLIRNVYATLPVPQGLIVELPAGQPAVPLASVDGRVFAAVPLKQEVKRKDGSRVLVDLPPSAYRALRWSLGTLDPGGRATVSARVRVESAAITVADKADAKP